MSEGSNNEIIECCFPNLSNKEVKRILAVSVMLEKKYKNPNLNNYDLIIETYLSISTGGRKFNTSHEYIDFVINSMRSIANNEINKVHNNGYRFERDSSDILPSDYDSPEERAHKESEIKTVFKALSEHDSLIEMARVIFIENITNMKDLSDRLGITIDQAKYLKKKIISLTKENILKTDKS